MRGATAPRLLLELLCARVLLPGADHTSEGVMARLERLERRLDVTGAPAAAAPAPAPAQPRAAEPAPPPPVPTSAPARDDGPPPPPPMPSSIPTPAAPQPTPPATPATQEAHAPSTEPVAEQPGGPRGGLSLVDVRRLWPDILEQTKNRRRLAWMVLSQHAHVVDVDATRLTVGFANAGARDSFVNGGCDEILRQAAIDVVGMDWRVESIVDPSGAAAQQPVVHQSSTAPRPAAADAAPAPDAPDAPPAWVTGEAPVPPPEQPPVSAAPAREALEAARSGAAPEAAEPQRSADDDVDPDDPDAESAALDTESLLSQTLGARLIEEIKHD
jgi:DNA polymerase-3 subunit gamma/tau